MALGADGAGGWVGCTGPGGRRAAGACRPRLHRDVDLHVLDGPLRDDDLLLRLLHAGLCLLAELQRRDGRSRDEHPPHRGLLVRGLEEKQAGFAVFYAQGQAETALA